MALLLPDIQLEIPAFLCEDQNGKAIKAAMEKALERLIGDVVRAWDILYNVDTMPEWRLNEMAWEWNMVWYDYTMPVEVKRAMVKRAEEISRGIGTPGLLKSMLETVFESVNILLGPEYGGTAYHFRVEVGGNRAGEMGVWAQRAVEIFKPLRSQFDGFIIQTTEADKIQVSSVLETTVRVELGE